MRAKKHAPARFSTYDRVHRSRMEQFLGGVFVESHDLEYEFLDGGVIRIRGNISCLGNILIRVNKFLSIVEEPSPDSVLDALVQTVAYEYNVSIQGFGNLFRFDNTDWHDGHPDHHHRHDFDWTIGKELSGSPVWVGVSGWPTLSEVIDLAETWYWENVNKLTNPNSHADLTKARKP